MEGGTVGLIVWVAEGVDEEGLLVVSELGTCLGSSIGDAEKLSVGNMTTGAMVQDGGAKGFDGSILGESVGDPLGISVGSPLGKIVGINDGLGFVGKAVGFTVLNFVGLRVGCNVGLRVGDRVEGFLVGGKK